LVLGARLKELRLKKGFSLQNLADKVEASKAHIWDLETGRAKNPSMDLLVKLAKSLNTTVYDLVGEALPTDDEPELVAMFRDLKDLNEDDRDVIRSMMERLRTKKS
tara:strand:- start:3456 stop:3773 length:318 start_codon:yes stop_codon:yes gene_type:complete